MGCVLRLFFRGVIQAANPFPPLTSNCAPICAKTQAPINTPRKDGVENGERKIRHTWSLATERGQHIKVKGSSCRGVGHWARGRGALCEGGP